MASTAGPEAKGPADPALAPVVDALEEDIVFGRLFPRERLIEEDLAARFQAKRHVVRRALEALERMGLVQRVPHRGATVIAHTPEAVEQLYAVREILETQGAARIALPVPTSDLEALRRVQEAHDRAVDTASPRDAFRANIAFHRALFALTGNPYLTEAIDAFAQRTHAIRSYSLTEPGYLARARAEHHAMIEALARGERGDLVRLCRDHLQPSKAAYLTAYRARPAG